MGSRRGRPAAWDEKYVKQAEVFSAMRLTQKEMALVWRIDEDTITKWKKKYAAFAEALERGRALLIEQCVEVLIDDVRLHKNTETAKYLLKHIARDRWGDSQQIEVVTREGMDLRKVEQEFWGSDAAGSITEAHYTEVAPVPEALPSGPEPVQDLAQEPESGGKLAPLP